MALGTLSFWLFPIFIIIAIVSILWSKSHKWCLFWSGAFVIMGFISRFTTTYISSIIIPNSELMTAMQIMAMSYFMIALVFAVWGIYCLLYKQVEKKLIENFSEIYGELLKDRKLIKDEKEFKRVAREWRELIRKKWGL